MLPPARTPPAIVYRVSTPAEFAAFLDAERAQWGAVIKQANVKIE